MKYATAAETLGHLLGLALSCQLWLVYLKVFQTPRYCIVSFHACMLPL